MKDLKISIGIQPEFVWVEQRCADLFDAMERYNSAGYTIPVKWIRELRKHWAWEVYRSEFKQDTCAKNVYRTVKIGNQIWMAENLKVTQYRNGDLIHYVRDNDRWHATKEGAFCAYSHDMDLVSTYGLLYNWYAVNDGRGLTPEGWHVPSDEEWKILEMYLGMSQEEANKTGWRGTNEGSKMKEEGISHWKSFTNESGFSALPGGYRDHNGNFYHMGGYALFWSATEFSGGAWSRYLGYDYSEVYRYYHGKQNGFSVRCIKD